jgi:hypothetical protein
VRVRVGARSVQHWRKAPRIACSLIATRLSSKGRSDQESLATSTALSAWKRAHRRGSLDTARSGRDPDLRPDWLRQCKLPLTNS